MGLAGPSNPRDSLQVAVQQDRYAQGHASPVGLQRWSPRVRPPRRTMASTLIVRDATLAINGAVEARGDARDHLHFRVEEVQTMDAETLAACAEVLRSSGSGEHVAADGVEHPGHDLARRAFDCVLVRGG